MVILKLVYFDNLLISQDFQKTGNKDNVNETYNLGYMFYTEKIQMNTIKYILYRQDHEAVK